MGEGQCPVHNPGVLGECASSTKVISTEGENGLAEQFLKWNGLYCPRHKAFYCAAEGDCSSCGVSREEHRSSMERFGGLGR
jgi:hypothetical protein